MESWREELYSNELYHHGIEGQKWGARNGPPYPLSRSQMSSAERRNRSTREFNETADRFVGGTDIDDYIVDTIARGKSMTSEFLEASARLKRNKSQKIKGMSTAVLGAVVAPVLPVIGVSQLIFGLGKTAKAYVNEKNTSERDQQTVNDFEDVLQDLKYLMEVSGQ